MGSSGSSRLSDYSGTPAKKTASASGRGGVSGGSSGEDRCDRAFSTTLEDFERSEYYRNHQSPPPVGTEISIEKEKRLIARTVKGESLGNLPTEFNYLAGCMAAGRRYAGRVISISKGLVMSKVTIDAAPL
jgi:hypothetical protein